MTRPSEVNLLCNVPPDALTGLTRLDVNGWTHITDTGVQCLSMLSNLRQLDLNNCRNITDAGVQSLSVLRNLQLLHSIAA